MRPVRVLRHQPSWAHRARVDMLMDALRSHLYLTPSGDTLRAVADWVAHHATSATTSVATQCDGRGWTRNVATQCDGLPRSAAQSAFAPSDNGNNDVEEAYRVTDGFSLELAASYASPSDLYTVEDTAPPSSGNYGAVYRGMRHGSSEPIAIKVVPLKATWSVQEAEQLVHCSRCAAEFDGPSRLVELRGEVAYDSISRELWIPMEWLPCTLETWVAHRRQNARQDEALFQPHEVRHAFRQLLEGCHFMSDGCRRVHLDIKPANVLCRRGPDQTSDFTKVELLLCDLGLASPIGTPAMQLGDFEYMAPEIHSVGEGDTFAAVNDIWSVGMVVLFLMNGESAWTWKAIDYFEALRDNYMAPCAVSTSMWPAALIHAVSLCFTRSTAKRPAAATLLEHALFSTTWDVAR